MNLDSSFALQALKARLREKGAFVVEQLGEVPKALLAALAVEATGKNLLLITGGTREDSLFENLSYFAPDLVLELPAWETLPGEAIAPSPDIIGKRMESLHALLHRKKPCILLCPLASLLQKLPAPQQLKTQLTSWRRGDRLPFNDLPAQLTSLGYKRVPVVSEKGEFAVRGGILDLFPASSSDPYRIDFFGDEIDKIRTFDPIGQKSLQTIPSFLLSPVYESSQHASASIGDYLRDPLLFFDDLVAIEESLVAFQSLAQNIPPAFASSLFTLEGFLATLNPTHQIICTSQPLETLSEVRTTTSQRTKYFQPVRFEAFSLSFEADRFFHPFQTIDHFFDDDFQPPENCHLLCLTSNSAEERTLRAKFPSAEFATGYLSAGFAITDIPFACVPYVEISHKPKIRRQKWRSTVHTSTAEFHQLTPGDLVVHFHSGIGRYLGMEKHPNHLGAPTEFLILEYASQSKLFVPLSQAYLVSRYIGAKEEIPSLSELGSKRWQTTRQQAQAQIVGYANDLLHLYAARAAHGGFQYAPDSAVMEQFEQAFPYEETQDQLLSIAAIKEDMVSNKAMDRLICGDVGYGKTEVAMRAAFKAVVDGHKQVAVLVPTTVLAMQHFETFTARMAGFPVLIEVVSRFRTPKQNREVAKRVAEGKVDILIGTHRLLSEDIQFKDLGLLIIDEEQRFGVRAKEGLKKRKVGVDCLTLSATPIPRTLYMSLVSARDMSVINTPPQDRLPVRSVIAETDLEMVAHALLREFARGGQAFFIHNRVETIYERAELIQAQVPAARIGIVHGQMDPDEIDPIFHRFKQGELDLLFATTIIENGIDIPNANTIFIDRADTYGLADLYQLRGRVGRWNRPAYAYFLTPKGGYLSDITRKRLNALAEAGSHGGGMKIAMRDLEIRGAGDLLGVQQSGQIASIGFHLYCKLLKRAISALKEKKTIRFDETKIECPYDARIPEDYIGEVSLRMELYYRMGEVSTELEVDELLAEMKDRFGEPPLPVLWLYHLARLRLFASALQITLLKFAPLTLLVEKVQGKEIEKKSMLLPKSVQALPQTLVDYVMQALRSAS